MLNDFRLRRGERRATGDEKATDRAGEGVEPSACVANIGPRQRRQRLNFGAIMVGAGAAACILLVLFGVQRPWRLLLIIPFSIGASGIFQAREKT